MSRPVEAAKRILAVIDAWRAFVEKSGETICIDFGTSGTSRGINPGPNLSDADLCSIASLGMVGVLMSEQLATWKTAQGVHADGGWNAVKNQPANAVGFLECLVGNGEAVAMKRFKIPEKPPGNHNEKLTPAPSHNDLNDTERSIANAIKSEPGIRGKELAIKLATTEENIRKIMGKNRKLWNLGYRQKAGRKSGYFPPA